MTEIDPELLRELAPRVLGALVRRYGNFANAEDDSLLLMFRPPTSGHVVVP